MVMLLGSSYFPTVDGGNLAPPKVPQKPHALGINLGGARFPPSTIVHHFYSVGGPPN